ncbi:hypothetical protein SAMN05216337_101793 [Bradyrhizobium brasilense]|uniref:ParB/Sulfiredoxin domain-containing protein n=1 Tax=Bradyrhizobium brasilense TaxID=1419277 RepID=A0A1G6YW31_9BRAD|nr:ParB N-terminal domain-containing protein [Bradyrhizobium brasilense]SDD93786.1 hypothetical protein SAMN05216337_101793 [Bradyrhizobium brasilense]
MELEDHPLAACFPLMTGAPFEQLVDDIRTHGVREPIVLLAGQILDGRNRSRAAQRLGIPAPSREYDGDDPLGYVVSTNLRRRHLKESQRALVAARLANCKLGGARQAKDSARISILRAAQMLNVSRSSARRASFILKNATDDLVSLVERGGVSCFAARATAALSAPKQQELIKRGPSAMSAHARRHGSRIDGRSKFAEIYRSLDLIADALGDSRLDEAHAAARRLVAAIEAAAGPRVPGQGGQAA